MYTAYTLSTNRPRFDLEARMIIKPRTPPPTHHLHKTTTELLELPDTIRLQIHIEKKPEFTRHLQLPSCRRHPEGLPYAAGQ
jgi:hypothetical protein